ncbi:MAG: hypothetical protein GX435_04530, partial [Exilispira sp.]|nr:hypothetical protein [Exilispira sp.]
MGKIRNAKIIILFFLILLFSMFYSCPNPVEPVTTVYIAGYYNNGSEDIACYWKDETKVDLETSSKSKANSIYVSGSDIYVAGYYYNGTNNIACYWK